MKSLVALLAMSLLVIALPAVASQPKVPATPLEMKGSQNKVVLFPHAPQEKVECVTCHHKVDGKENFQKCADAGCHDDLKAKKGDKSLYAAIHTKTGLKHQTCMECHTKQVAEKPEKKKELTGCAKSKCHP
jgi:hypothetical protein